MTSPIPFSFGLSIFTSTLHTGNPTEPYLIDFAFSAHNTGDVSVNPYPCTVNIPKALKSFATFLSIAFLATL